MTQFAASSEIPGEEHCDDTQMADSDMSTGPSGDEAEDNIDTRGNDSHECKQQLQQLDGVDY